MLYKSKLNLNFSKAVFPDSVTNPVLEIIAERLILGKCPEGASLEFVFEKELTKKTPRGIYIGRSTTRAIQVTVVYNGNKSMRGFLKPMWISRGQKMTLDDLSKYLEPVVSILPVNESSSLESTQNLEKPEPKVKDIVKRPYTLDEVMRSEFISLFIDLLPILYQESGKKILASRDIAPLFNESKSSFCEDDRFITVMLTGKLLTFLFKENKLVLVGNGRPYGLYKLPDTNGEEETSVPAVEVPPKVEKVDAATVEIPPKNENATVPESLDVTNITKLLECKKALKAQKESLQRDVFLVRERLLILERDLENFETQEAQIDKEVERYRTLFQALHGIFG